MSSLLAQILAGLRLVSQPRTEEFTTKVHPRGSRGPRRPAGSKLARAARRHRLGLTGRGY